MKDKYHQLKTAMFARRVTQGALAQEVGITEQALNAKLNGRGDFYIREAEKIIAFLELENPSNIFFDQGLRGA